MSTLYQILVIEDEPGILSTISICLKAEGYLVESASTGAEGLTKLTSGIHLIILDIGLPDKNGIEVLKEIRKNFETPVLFLTARNSEIDRVLGFEVGADDYVTKPFSPRELVYRIQAILRRSYPSNQSNKTSLVHDLEKKQIKYKNEVLILSPYEYKTLALFIKYPGRIFTREEIMDMVWTEPEESFDRAVDTVIKNIRSRFKEIQTNLDPIETRRGLGYGLKEKYETVD